MDVHLAPVGADFVTLGSLNVHCRAPVAAAGHASRVGGPEGGDRCPAGRWPRGRTPGHCGGLSTLTSARLTASRAAGRCPRGRPMTWARSGSPRCTGR
ncbi:hypothetical protein SHJG_6883 [Streptomyces hygroscopicus subsp. jinggangensis 5008]|nr:hypothetical protein SHJG_6883 [Streptomyces hygroscopicus subsp. jinggangensis 5008]AGF66305.1 hypothetical protein SHJGH_6643 [Streptomyces hygroscopicus subsp. jinggangensis TL01]